MNELKRKTFESIFRILLENGLIVIDDKTEEKKSNALKSFQSVGEYDICSSFDKQINEILITLDVDCSIKKNFFQIYEQIVNQFDLLKSSFKDQQEQIHGQQKQIQGHQQQIQCQKEQLHGQQKQIQGHQQQIQCQKEQIHGQQEQLHLLKQEMNALQSKMISNELKINAYEAVRLFQCYFVIPIIKKLNLRSWNHLTDEWSKRELVIVQQLGLQTQDVFSDQVQQHPTIRQLISPIEVELGKQTNSTFQMIDLRKISTERHAVAHTKIRSVTDQRLFLGELQSKNFPDQYAHSSTLKKIIICLSSLDLNPENTKLHSIH